LLVEGEVDPYDARRLGGEAGEFHLPLKGMGMFPKTLDRYLLRRHFGPFLFAMFTITFIFVLRVLVDFLDLFASRHLGLFTVLEMFALSLGWILALTIPMAVLVAVVMTFGRMSQDFELDAMQATGISFFRTILPIGLMAGALSFLLFVYNNAVLPEANHRLKTLTTDIHRTRPTIAIREGVFMDDFEGYRLLVREVDDLKNELRDVTVYVLDPRQPVRTIHAPRGKLLFTDQGNRLNIRLYDGEIHEVDKDDPGSYYLLHFNVHDLNFGDLGTRLERREEGSSRGDRELSVEAMRARSDSLRAEKAQDADSLSAVSIRGLHELRDQIQMQLGQSPTGHVPRPTEVMTRARMYLRKLQSAERQIDRKERDIHKYEVEIQKKYAFPFACIVFVFLGAPLGAWARRGGAGVGGGLSFLFFLAYYMATLGGEKLGDRGIIPAAVGMWGINVLLGLVGLAFVLRKDGRFPFRKKTLIS
jgi:lipopolysaccharide export system permease protein